MTAEVAVMNKMAVALAADSAVTVPHSGGFKIYNTVNKLFMLSKYQPVGIMIYGNAELMGVPWELIIKTYRKSLGDDTHPTVAKYAEHFLRFLEVQNNFFPPAYQASYVNWAIRSTFEQIKQEIDKLVESALEDEGSISDE